MVGVKGVPGAMSPLYYGFHFVGSYIGLEASHRTGSSSASWRPPLLVSDSLPLLQSRAPGPAAPRVQVRGLQRPPLGRPSHNGLRNGAERERCAAGGTGTTGGAGGVRLIRGRSTPGLPRSLVWALASTNCR